MPRITLTAKPVIDLKNVDKVFANGTVAIRSVDLSLRQGEFTCIVGPSGCGKSTVLRMMAGLASVTSGEVRWGQATQQEGSGHEGSGSELGFVFQEPTLLPWLRIWENVFLPLRLKGQSKQTVRQRVDEALAMVGLSDFAHAYPRELSGGMKMRVSIARALVTSPKLLLMDEPFGALDELTRFELNDRLLELWRQHQWTIAFVTHSVYEAVYLAQRVLVMSARPGRISADIAVDAPCPRDVTFRRSNAYHETCTRVSQALLAASGV